jgi:uncharacterized protein (DUF362 family)
MDSAGAKVAIARTRERHRSPERVLNVVREALGHLGGIGAFVIPGQSVLLKPNQTVFYSAEDGCTTDPLVVGALIRLAKEAGAAKVQVAESSGGYFASLECMKITGMAAVAEREGAELIDLGSDRTPNVLVPVPRGEVLKEVPLPKPLVEADVIINVPKAKNHHIEPITGALKNWVGVVNQDWRNHNHGDEEHVPRFMDLMTVSRPHLNVADALICGEGDGPIGNLPRWCGCVLASSDPVALDKTLARLMGHDGRNLKFAKEAEKRGLGVREPIQYLGVPIEEASFRAWPGHDETDHLPINLFVGGGVTVQGTVGHVRSVLDSMLRRGDLQRVIWIKGTPTVMIGDVEDPNFEEHLREGPYVVFDDAARSEYKQHPKVHFVPGHPVLQTAMPELMKGLGVEYPGKALMKWQQFEQWGRHNVGYGTPVRKALTFAKPLAAVGIGVAAVVAARAALRSNGR